MTDWLTIQWPARRDARGRAPEGFPDEPEGVWIQREHAEVAHRIQAGDRVFVYETRTGPSLRQAGIVYSCVRGRQGIVAVGVVGRLEPPNDDVQHYTTGRRRRRQWSFGGGFASHVDLQGFVPRWRLNRILGYSRNYVYLGFGESRSGTGELSRQEAKAIQREFEAVPRRPPSI